MPNTRADCRKGFVVHADEKLTAFLELERAVCIHLLSEQNLEKGSRQAENSWRRWRGVFLCSCRWKADCVCRIGSAARVGRTPSGLRSVEITLDNCRGSS